MRDDLLHHCTQTPPLGGMRNRAVRLDQFRLAHDAKNIDG